MIIFALLTHNQVIIMKVYRIVAAALLSVILCSCAQNVSNSDLPANKKDIMDQFLAGTLDPSYVPAAFFVHYRNDQKDGEPAVLAHLEYFLKSNMDILKIQFEQAIPAIDGLDEEEGWNNIPEIPIDFYRPTVEIVKRLFEIAGDNVYVLPTFYSPHQVATHSFGIEKMKEGAVNHPEAYKKALDNYAAALTWYVDECKRIGIEGFYMCTQGGELIFDEIPGYFDNYVKPYDMTIMGDATTGTKLNILHICDWEGPMGDLTRYADYPAQIVNTPILLDGTPFSLEECISIFNRPVLGGIDRHKEINTYSEDELAAFIDNVLDNAPKGKTMLGAECTVSSAPWSNIQRAIDVAHHRN